jgi:hypothetical protein
MSGFIQRLSQTKFKPGTSQGIVILGVAIAMALMDEKMGACMLMLGYEVGFACKGNPLT